MFMKLFFSEKNLTFFMCFYNNKKPSLFYFRKKGWKGSNDFEIKVQKNFYFYSYTPLLHFIPLKNKF